MLENISHASKYILFFISSFSIFSSAYSKTNSTDNWNGGYIGIKTGAAFSSFTSNTSTQPGLILDPPQSLQINSAGQQNLSLAGYLAGIEAGFNWQIGNFLLGLESDMQALSTSGLSYSNFSAEQINPIVLTFYADNNWLFSLRPRLGYVQDNWFIYATSGLSLALIRGDFLFTGNGSFASQKTHQWTPGYNIGGGVETSLSKHLSLKIEYLWQNFVRTNAAVMHALEGQNFENSLSLNSNLINIGLNYYPEANFTNPALLFESFSPSQWSTELGARWFLSSGQAGAPQPLFNTTPNGTILASRLTFSSLFANSLETFARVNHSSGLFLKGYLGAGTIQNAQLNDEDMPAGDAYSNTLSTGMGNLAYATIDIGYNFFANLFARSGLFVGYNYYAHNMNFYNCQQLAGSQVCVPSSSINNFLILSEDDRYNSLRLGVNTEFWVSKKLKLSSEVAYLPMVIFHGLDMHNGRALVLPERASGGDGVMLEALLNYQLNSSWDLGFGGRYWVWNMHNGSVTFDFLDESFYINEPARFNNVRYGAVFQVNYHSQKLIKELAQASWDGLWLGANLGGSWSRSTWSDPFPSSPSYAGAVNIAGFGDKLQNTGPFGGVDLSYNWQKEHLVYGVGANFSASDIRGQNTLFTGIDGINAAEKIRHFGLIFGRLGASVNQALFYLNAGTAVVNNQTSILANTLVLNLGQETRTSNIWGWMLGAGIAYQLSDNLNTNVEYDYLNVNHKVFSPILSSITDETIMRYQAINLFRLGVNYRFNLS